MSLIATRPGPGAARAYRFPQVVRRTVAGGQVVAAHLPGQNLAVALLLLDGGAGREPVGKEGLGAVLAKALEEGTAQRDATAYALAIEALGTELSTGLDWDSFQVSVQVPVDRLTAAVELLAEAVRTPRLDPADVRRVRDDEATALRMDWANPGPRADAVLRAELFGAQHRWGRPLYGDPDSVAALEVDDVTVFHSEWFIRPGTLVVAGDLERIDLDALAATAFAGAGGGPVERGGPIDVPLAGQRRIILVDRPGSVQSTLRLGHPSPHRAHPDHVPMTLAGTVLGGAFTSRLNHLIREVRGYTYGIRGDFASSRRFGRFAVSSGVQTAVTAPALVESVGEISRTRLTGVTEDELEVARSWRAGQLSVELQSPRAIAAALTTLVVHDLPDDYHARLREQLLAATVEDVSAAAATYLHPESLTMVIEGDAAVIRDELVASGLGEVVDHT
ncbi:MULTISPECIES: pitrilysin family protein [unclassified Micromonospora]|uniref:M16 family metallopeptidase n=1 Tax=unclassified Micromonospora TaxID=2617518 RepID=UPI00188F7530|nr:MULTISPECIES: pitrilysin family protein [unclassified Micromonospora]MBF5030714.1 insulinase family protein [Micromonospora sp. ANENR4]WBC01940.1 pitrilysin family protein [Micromonospora sp. WMMA1976]